MKILVLSGQGADTGCYLRSRYIANSLRKLNNEVICIKPIKSLPFFLDFPITLFLYLFKTFFKKFDVVIAMKPYPNACIAGIFHKIKGSKLIIDVDDIDYGYRKGLLPLIVKLVQKPFPKMADMVTYHNENLLPYISGNFKVKSDKTYNIGQGVDINIFGKKVPEDIKEKLIAENKLQNKKIIVYTAHLNIAACLEEIFQAFLIVSNKIKNAGLIIAGGGPMLGYYLKMAEKMNLKDNVIFTGFLENFQIVNYISIADVCAVYYKDMPVNYHRTSMKLREYLCQGKAIVCNDVGELKDFSGFTYQSKSDIPDFADKIINVLEGKNMDNREEKGRKYIMENLNWDTLAYKFNQELIKKFTSN